MFLLWPLGLELPPTLLQALLYKLVHIGLYTENSWVKIVQLFSSLVFPLGVAIYAVCLCVCL